MELDLSNQLSSSPPWQEPQIIIRENFPGERRKNKIKWKMLIQEVRNKSVQIINHAGLHYVKCNRLKYPSKPPFTNNQGKNLANCLSQVSLTFRQYINTSIKPRHACILVFTVCVILQGSLIASDSLTVVLITPALLNILPSTILTSQSTVIQFLTVSRYF